MFERLKEYKLQIILSSLVVVFPAAAGTISGSLFGTIFENWGGESILGMPVYNAMGFVLLPLIMLAAHWVCLLLTAADPKNRTQSKKTFGLVIWIMPAVSLFSSAVFYVTSSGADISPELIIVLMLSVMFIATGNLMPKFRQNSTLGIRVTWTLQSEENWNATHRFCGKVWVVSGVIMLFSLLLPDSIALAVSMAATIALSFIPMLYSYLYYKKQLARGETFAKKAPLSKKPVIFTVVITVVILTFCTVMLFTGDIVFTAGGDGVDIAASYHPDLSVPYRNIDSIEYRESFDTGTRVNGFGSPRLLMGIFRNDEFGTYSLYAYTGAEDYIVLTRGTSKLVLAPKTADEATALFDAIRAKLPQ